MNAPLLFISDHALANLAEIFFGTIFSIALIWVIIRIWNKDDDVPGSGPQ